MAVDGGLLFGCEIKNIFRKGKVFFLEGGIFLDILKSKGGNPVHR